MPGKRRRKTRSGTSCGAGKKPSDRTTQYAHDVIDGRVVAGELVRLACKRHLDDLAAGAERGLRFDADHATDAVVFFETFLRLYEGEHAGKPFLLQPWQAFIVGSLFGWKTADGYRRFRTAYVEIGKGNGKSPMAAGIGLLGLLADGEPGAEIYSAAVTRDQAKILFRDAEHMVEASPELCELVERHVNNLSVPSSASFFRPVSSEKRGLDGKRVHMALVDELHEHPSAIVVDKMRAGTKGRRQALIFEITNSGYDRNSVCWQHHEYSRKVLQGIVPNDSWFAYVSQLEPCPACAQQGKTQPNEQCKECDDWRDPRFWPKVNPNLGISVTDKYLREQVQEAIGIPAKENIVKRLNFCIWTEQAERYLPMGLWDECASGISAQELETELKGLDCVIGLDLASRADIAAAAFLFPPKAGSSWRVFWRFWVPGDNVAKRADKDHVPYDVWIRQGYITPTPGSLIDFDVIREDIKATAARHRVLEIGFDPWNAMQIGTQLASDKFQMVEMRQGMATLTEPTKELLNLVISKNLEHGGNPVARWMASNVAVVQDAAGNVRPARDRSTEKIDGIVALVMALGRAIRQPGAQESVYERRGVVTI